MFVELGLRHDPSELRRCRPPVEKRRHALPCSGSTTARKAISSKSSSAADGLGEGRRGAVGEEAVEVAFVGDLDHRADRRREQLGVLAHLGALAGRRVEDARDLGDRFVVRAAAGTDQVEQVLDLGVVGDHVAVVVEVDEVVRVEAVAAVDVLVGVDVPQREDDARLEPLGRVGRDDGVETLRERWRGRRTP